MLYESGYEIILNAYKSNPVDGTNVLPKRFDSTQIDGLHIENGINSQIVGNFVIKDTSQLMISKVGVTSDMEGIIVLGGAFACSNLNINEDEGIDGSIPILIKSWSQIAVEGQYATIQFEFVGGRYIDNISKSNAISSENSIGAMSRLLQFRDADFILGADKLARDLSIEPNYLNPNDMPVDGGHWYCMHQNLFSQLSYVCDHSFIIDDYIFWVYDEINSVYKITSISEQYAHKDIHQLTYNPSLVMDKTCSTITHDNKNNEIQWHFNQVATSSVHGSNYESVFPNVSYTMGYSERVDSSVVNFNEFLKKGMDGNPIPIQGGNLNEFTDVNNGNSAVYGDRKVKRMNTLNTNRTHAFNYDYREYKIGTFGRITIVNLFNNFGPPIGEYVSLYSIIETDRVQSKVTPDKSLSGRYLLSRKEIDISSEGLLRTKLVLISDSKTLEANESI